MRAKLLCALVLIAQATPAWAATEDECDRSWNTLDPSRRGVLRGDDAQRFMDDMRAKGVQVYSRTGEITARQYRNACIKDFWANLDEEER
jgi:hypothetical protein